VKKLLLISAIMGLSLQVSSQAAIFALLFGDKVASENFNVSLEAGVASSGISNLNFDPARNVGVQFGIGFNIKLSDNISISPGGYFFSTRSVKLADAPVYQGQNVEIVEDYSDVIARFQYIDVPVKVSYTFNNSLWSVGLAPQVSFLTNTSAKYVFGNSETLTADISDFAEKFEYGIQAFVGRTFKFSEKKIMVLGIRYYQGFNDVVRQETGFTKGNNRSNYIGAMVSFPFIEDTDK
jgi:hypothetical protein